MRAMIFIAKCSNEGKRASVDEIAIETNTPKHFISKILQSLVRENLLESAKGPNGGFSIKNKKTSLAHVILALDGREFFTSCALGLSKCTARKPCPIHFQFIAVREILTKSLEDASLNQIVERLVDKKYKLR